MTITYTTYNSDGSFAGVITESSGTKNNVPKNGFSVDGEYSIYTKYVNGAVVDLDQDEISEIFNPLNMATFRVERNSKLAESDWTDLPNCPLSDSKKTEWQTYRQALRDMPSQEGFDPLNPTYPTEPTQDFYYLKK